MGRLRLNDASFSYEMETSAALGFGFRCGFLRPAASRDHPGAAGARVQSRPDRDRAVGDLPHRVDRQDDDRVAQSRRHARRGQDREIQEPWIKATILTPDDYLGAILKLCQDRRGTQIDLNYVGKRAMVVYELPLNEVVFDFYDG